MQIKLPPIDGKEVPIEDKKSIVLIGANGSGKTRMSIWIEQNEKNINVHRISAQKSLNMPKYTSYTSADECLERLMYGSNDKNKEWLKTSGKNSNRWHNAPEIHLLDDFNQLMGYLLSEESEKSIEYREKHKSGDSDFDNETILDRLRRIWKDAIPNKELTVKSGAIEVDNIQRSQEKFNGSQMSDGERAAFYFIGEVLSVPENSLIIIDEPENHLHKSILVRLWNAIEKEKKNCSFLYITHDLEFALSRVNSQLIWVQDMPKIGEWKYKLLKLEEDINPLKLEILGSRQKILIVEGKLQNSYDVKIYTSLFPEYNVYPVEGCSKVIELTKAYNNSAVDQLHYCEVKGIVDRDRRDENEIRKLREHNIFCLDVAEVENLFLLPEVIECVCIQQKKADEKEEIINNVKNKVFEFLENNIDAQALLFTKNKIINQILADINKSADSIDKFSELVNKNYFSLIDEVHNSVKSRIGEILDTRNYDEALSLINDKGLIPYTKISNEFGWKKDAYIEFVIRCLQDNDEIAIRMRKAMLKYINIDD